MIYWIYLIIASCFEIGWIYSLKFLQFKNLFKLGFAQLFTEKEGLLLLLPAAGYLLCGVGNIVFFSKAMKEIPASVSYAVWTAVALTGLKLIDTFILKEAFSFTQLFFMCLIIAGIIGLKFS